MRGWPDVAGIADELVDLTSDARTASSTSADVSRSSAQSEAALAASAPYGDVPRAPTRAKVDSAALYEIYKAACRAMSVQPASVPAAPARVSVLRRLARFGKPK
jgi:hypothetical protein